MNLTTKTVLFIVSVAVVIAVVLAFMLLPGSTGRIRIMDPVEANNLHVPLAKDLGLFEERGLDVEVSGTSAGKFAMDALNAEAVEYAVVVEMNVAQSLFNSSDYAILAEIAQPTTAVKLLGRRDHGIESAHDLVGKRVGVLFGVNIHLFILRFLDDHDIDRTRVELVNLTPPNAVAAFENGDIDAIVTWQPHVYRLQEALGERVTVITEDSQAYWTYKMILVARASYLEGHRDEARKVIAALVEADEVIDTDRDKAVSFLARHLEMEREPVESFFDEIRFEVRLDEELLNMLAADVEFLRNTPSLMEGREPVTTDYRGLIASLLADIKPSAFRVPNDNPSP